MVAAAVVSKVSSIPSIYESHPAWFCSGGDDRGPTADWVAEWLPERRPFEESVQVVSASASTKMDRVGMQASDRKAEFELSTVITRLAGPVHTKFLCSTPVSGRTRSLQRQLLSRRERERERESEREREIE